MIRLSGRVAGHQTASEVVAARPGEKLEEQFQDSEEQEAHARNDFTVAIDETAFWHEA